MPLSTERLQDILVGSGFVEAEPFEKAIQDAKSSGLTLDETIVSQGILKDQELGKLLADIYHVPFIDFERVGVDPVAVATIPEIITRRQGVLAYAWKDGRLQVAMRDPSNIEIVDFIEKKSGHPIDIGYTTAGLFDTALDKHSEDLRARMLEIANEFVAQTKRRTESRKSETDDTLVIQLVEACLQNAYANRSSDIHIEPQEKKVVIRYRVDGILHDVIDLPKELHDPIVARIKIMSNLRTDEHFVAQDGKLKFQTDGRQVDVRVSIVPVVGGEKAVLRILAEHGRVLTLENIGFTEADQERLERAMKKPYGMILATGPTGSGKTSSMYSVLKRLNSREVNVQTIEDPVEYDIPGVNQIQVNNKTDLTFAKGLRSIVRQDPDIILVGEIRDSETASIAVNAAMTGHLVLSTLHTNDAATSIPRLLEMGAEPFLVASSVNLVIAQRLVRRICSHCITSKTEDLDVLKKNIDPGIFKKIFGVKKKDRLFVGKGCVSCGHSGFEGRVGIFELFEMSNTLREMIMKRDNASVLMDQAIKEGMTTMLEDGLKKAQEGVTTISEVLRVAKY